uniref:Aspartate kinase III n=1 Tax=mine drainage metagenome TaxID=410659 RepID=E6QCY3_9ZZZZ
METERELYAYMPGMQGFSAHGDVRIF